MTNKKEIVAGLIFLLCASIGIFLATGWFGLLAVIVTIILAQLALLLFNRKSFLAKSGGVILYSDLLFKLLVPRSTRRAIQELEEAEKKNSSNI